jgi:hypothetical protein
MIWRDVELYNVVETIEEGDVYFFLRVPNHIRKLLNPAAQSRARYPTGCEIRFNLASATAKIVLQCQDDEYPTQIPGVLEVFQGSFYTARYVIGREPTEVIVSLPPNVELLDRIAREKQHPYDAYLTRILLPHFAPVKLLSIEGQTAPPKPGQVPSRKYLAYGSSITHGRAAFTPSSTYATRTAQILGMDLVNLGFGAGAHCERELANYIAESNDWDLITLEIGVNMIGSFEISEFKQRAEDFVQRIAQEKSDRLIICIDLFPFYPWQEYAFAPVPERQEEFRAIVRNIVRQLGRPNLIHLDGRELLEDLSGLSCDLVHPSPAGMEEIAHSLSCVVQRAWGTNTRCSA